MLWGQTIVTNPIDDVLNVILESRQISGVVNWFVNEDIVRIEGLGKWIGRVAALGGGPAPGPRLELGR